MNVVHLRQAVQNKAIDELLDVNTPSKPAALVWESRSLFRIHLEEDDPRLPEAKRQIKEIKAAIKAELYDQFGDEWESRMPSDIPIRDEFGRTLPY